MLGGSISRLKALLFPHVYNTIHSNKYSTGQEEANMCPNRTNITEPDRETVDRHIHNTARNTHTCFIRLVD